MKFKFSEIITTEHPAAFVGIDLTLLYARMADRLHYEQQRAGRALWIVGLETDVLQRNPNEIRISYWISDDSEGTGFLKTDPQDHGELFDKRVGNQFVKFADVQRDTSVWPEPQKV